MSARTSGVFHILARNLLHVLWPVYCPVCGKLGESICPECLDGLARMPAAVCIACGTGEPCALHPEGPYCHGVTRYDALNRHVVHAMKYRNARRVALMMGECLAQSLAKPDADCLVPVPLHRGSERDYNQADLIARGAGRVWGIPVLSVLVWNKDVLRQARASRAEERFLSNDAIIAAGSLSFHRRACLVDDVHTTGNTLRAARAALERAECTVTGAVVWSIS